MRVGTSLRERESTWPFTKESLKANQAKARSLTTIKHSLYEKGVWPSLKGERSQSSGDDLYGMRKVPRNCFFPKIDINLLTTMITFHLKRYIELCELCMLWRLYLFFRREMGRTQLLSLPR